MMATSPPRSFRLLSASLAILLSSSLTQVNAEYKTELIIRDDAIHNSYSSPLPHTWLDASHLPDSFNWGSVGGISYLTASRNQHLAQYCGSCWCFGATSALADRLKIARLAQGDDINLAIQFVLNCGTDYAGSCHGGYHTGVYEFIQRVGYIPYDTCMNYIACSHDSTEGFCPHVDTTCKVHEKADGFTLVVDPKSMHQVCRTCDTFAGMGGACTAISKSFPNATVAEYGMIDMDDNVVTKIQTEIFVRGPVAATINAEPIVDYKGGVFADESFSQDTNHIVSIVGWETNKDTGLSWIIRNSWGEYWGEMGFMRLVAGKNLLGIEEAVAWATPGSYTVHNFPCSEDGKNCNGKPDAVATEHYVDPSNDMAGFFQTRLNLSPEAARTATTRALRRVKA